MYIGYWTINKYNNNNTDDNGGGCCTSDVTDSCDWSATGVVSLEGGDDVID